MTREEEIARLKVLTDYEYDEDLEALEIAIKTLEQEPCEDCISRQAVDELSKELVHTSRDKADFLCNFWEGLQKLPSVTPKEKTGHWIQQPRYDGDDQPDLVCPNCGFKISWWDMGNFCAKCGTGLEGGAG